MKGLKIILLAIAIVLLAPAFASAQVISTPEPWDYRNGLLDHHDLFTTTSSIHPNGYDNNLSTETGVALSEDMNKYRIDFNYPVNIRGMFLSLTDISTGYLRIYFYDGTYKDILFDGSVTGYFEISYDNVVSISFYNPTNQYVGIREVEFFGSYKIADTTPPADVTGLTATEGNGEVTLSYTFPPDDDFSHVKIYQDGNLIADNIKTTTYKVTGLSNGRKYTFRVVAVDTSGNESAGVTVSATPQEVSREVQNVRVTAKHDRVNLSWTNPKRNDFHHVKIYRKTLQKQAIKILPVAHAAEGYDPIFETNGTYFNDLTVQPETSYEYKLTTEDKNGVESTGVTVQVTTPPIPPPSTGGTTIIRHENGDVTVRWTPQPGQMVVEIDGAEYTRVDAQLGEYTIPAADIPVDEHGRPAEIRLIPVAPNGDTGTPIVINPGGWLIALPFGAKELLEAGIDLLAVFGPIILLVLVLWYVRPIMRLLRQSARGRART